MKNLLYTILGLMLFINFTQAQTVWTGSVDSDWTNAANWSAGIPVSGGTATVPGAPQGGNFPTFSGSPIIDYTLQNGGTITFNTIVFNSATVVNFSGSTIINNDAIINTGGALFDNDGILDNNGTFSNYSNYDHAASAILNNNLGSTFNNFSTFASNGQINNSGLFNNAGSFSNSNGMNNAGTFDISGICSFPTGSNLDNPSGGQINILTGAIMDMNGVLPNSGDITVAGELSVQSSCILTNDGTVTNNNEIQVAGSLTNNSTFTNNGNLLINSAGFIANYSLLDNTGNIELEVCGILEQHAGNNIAAPVDNGGLVYEINGTVDEVSSEFGDVFTDITATQGPIPACKMDNVFVLDETGMLEITAEDIDRGRSYGSCGATLVDFNISPSSFTEADLGVVIVTLTITDNFGNVSSCDDFVSILPYLAPVVEVDDNDIDFNCPSDISVTSLPGAQFAEATWTEPAATTSCQGGGSIVEIEARGNIGGEDMSLFINGSEVQSWTAIGTTLSTFQYVHSSAVAADNVQVHFTNDQTVNGDYNLYVDKIIVDGQAYETEDPSVFGIGVWDGVACNVYTNHQTERLACDGYFQYAGGIVIIECISAPLVRWDFDACIPNTNSNYDEFTPSYLNGQGCTDISATNVYRQNGNHTCVAPRTGSTGFAQAVGTRNPCSFKDDDPHATRFEVTLTPETAGQLTEFSFWERAPEYYDPIDFSGGNNNYPTLYGMRILKGGTEIYRQVDISTTDNWTKETFDLTSVADFQISSAETFEFEIRAYCRVGISAPYAAWEIDEFILSGCCDVEVPACNAVTENIPGFQFLGEFENSKYFISNDRTTWTDAQATSSAAGGNLASISSQAENDFIMNNMNPASGSVWIGLNTVSSPGVFNWSTGEPVVFTNWSNNEPNGNGIDNAARMKKSNGTWTDRNVDNYNYEYVLEINCPNGGGGGTGGNDLTVTQIRGPLPGSNFSSGDTEIAYEVTDACGNLEVCTFNVTVIETPADFQIIQCQSDTIVNTAPGATFATVSWPLPDGTSTCFRGGPIGVEQTVGFENGEDFPIGTSTILYAVFDSCGNFGQCGFNITVNFVPAVLNTTNCQADETILIPAGQTGTNVTWEVPTATTDCFSGLVNVQQLSGPANGSFLPLGTTQVIYLINDECGSTEICIFFITVEEEQSCANEGGDADGDGVCANDDCDDNDPNLPATPGSSCDDGDPTTINDVYAANGCDCAGVNTTLDIVCPADIVVDAAPGATSASVSWSDAAATSDCNVGTVSVSQIAGPAIGADIATGTTVTVTYEAIDGCTNATQCSFDITVNAVASTATLSCPDDITVTGMPGDLAVPASWSEPTATSDCINPNISIQQVAGPASGSDFPEGVTNISYDATDGCGGSASCSFTVTVVLLPCVDADNDGVCVDDDCDDSDPSIPTAPGSSCDDGNPNTVNDVIGANGCDCAGVPTSLSIICPANIVATTLPGELSVAVSWDEPTVITDCETPPLNVIQTAGPVNGGNFLIGITGVSYEATNGCGQMESCSFTVTVVDTPCLDGDGDGVCEADDCDDNDPSIPTTPGTACDDGDANTINDVIQADGCTCAGVDPCAALGGDTDGDGVCAADDCDDNDPSLPTSPGTTCDDGDPNTSNDQIQADGCTCQGTGGPTLDCNSIVVTTGDGSIIVDGINNAPITTVQIFNASWVEVFNCAGNCDLSTQVITGLPQGTYFVKVAFYNEFWQPICAAEDFYNVTSDPVDPCENAGSDADADGVCADDDCNDNDASIPATPGTSCDDGDANTINDVIQADGCTCAGELPPNCDNAGGDADGDGVCAEYDCDDNDASIPAAPGTTCDDDDANTSNDVIQADGCTCQGTTGPSLDCNSIVVTTGDGSITVDGLNNAPITSVQVFNVTWTEVFNCAGNCDPNTEVITGLPIGTYFVKVAFYNEFWQPLCAAEEFYTVTGDPVDPCENAGGDADADGVCADDDCDDNDASVPAMPGTSCDDGDANTINDVIQADGCTCAGELPPNCDNAGGDADGDGVCADDDCDDNDASVPTAPGTTCDDGDALTENDVIGADECTCAGTPVGQCSATIEVISDVITISGLTSPVSTIFVFDAGFSTVFSCAASDCDTPEQLISGLPAGTYYVKVEQLDASWQLICQVADYYTIGSGVQAYTIQEVQTFEAHKGQRNVELFWATNTEYKNDHFELERSNDGSNFETIKEVNSESEDGEVRLYNRIDKNPELGTNYYRLKRVYFDGTFDYSEVREVEFGIDLNDWALFPNPAVNLINVHLNKFEGKKALIEVYNNLGQKMTYKEFDALPADPILFQLSNYTAGMYSLTVKIDGQKRLTKLFVVTKY